MCISGLYRKRALARGLRQKPAAETTVDISDADGRIIDGVVNHLLARRQRFTVLLLTCVQHACLLIPQPFC